jgi:hypothetical protein
MAAVELGSNSGKAISRPAAAAAGTGSRGPVISAAAAAMLLIAVDTPSLGEYFEPPDKVTGAHPLYISKIMYESTVNALCIARSPHKATLLCCTASF